MELPLLQDILVLLGFSVLIVFILRKLELPSILGFLLTGIIIGPYGLSLIHAVDQVEVLSEIGVILLLFVIGMEMSIKQLAAIRRTVFIGGLIQVGLTILVSASIARLFDFTWTEAVFIGFLFSLSSTAIVLSVLADRNEISSAQGKNALALLIFQDIIVVPMMLMTPIMAGEAGNLTTSVLALILKTVLVLVITYVSARFIVPRLLYIIAKTRSKELFLITTITICFAVAYLTSAIGLSLALGAFLAGLIISESEYSHEATGIIIPFKELFISIFFISVGMLMDLSFFIENMLTVVLIAAAVLLVKSLVAGLAIGVLKYPSRTAVLTGLSLFQVGEFSFILSKIGIQYNLLTEQTNQYFLAVSILTMLLTPFVIMYSEDIYTYLLKVKFIQSRAKKRELKPKVDSGGFIDKEFENHLIIVGYGINGRNLAKAAEFSHIPYLVLELNAETVKEEQKKGVPIIFGDAKYENVLQSVNLSNARAVVLAISDPNATRDAIRTIRGISHSVYLLVRTRYIREIKELLALGADDVIPEEFETSIEIFSRILHNFLVPEGDIDYLKESIRTGNYELLEMDKALPKTYRLSDYPNFNITCMRVNRDSGKILNTPLKELDLRNKYGVNVLGIARDNELLKDIRPEEIFHQNDLVYVVGAPDCIEKFHDVLN